MRIEDQMENQALEGHAAIEGEHGHGHSADGRREKGYGHHHGRHGHPGHRWEADDDSLSGLLRRCGHVLHCQGKAHGQKRVLKLLREAQQLSQKELQEALGIRPGSVSELISKLEDKGLLRREKDERDKRRAVLVLTEAGMEAAKTMPESEEPEHLYNALTQEEQETLRQLLKKLTASWSEN